MDTFREWVEMQGRPVHATPHDVEYLQKFNEHVADLRNAQSKEQELGLYSGLAIKEISVPVSIDSENRPQAGGPELWSTTIQARVYTPMPCGGPCPLVIYFRGEFVAGSLETEDATCRQLAKLGRYVVLNVNYRNAPRYKYPTPLQDCWDAVKWAARHARDQLQADPSGRGFIVGGTSTGALLAAAITIRARDMSLSPPITGQILRSPILIHPAMAETWTDPPLHSLFADVEYPLFSRQLVEQIFQGYGVPREAWSSPFVSPLLAPDLAGLPAAYLQITALDPCRDEGLAYERRLSEAGIRTRMDLYEGWPHMAWHYPRLKGAANCARDLVLGAQWLEVRGGWDCGLRDRVELWAKDGERTEGVKRWSEQKLCQLDRCGCFM